MYNLKLRMVRLILLLFTALHIGFVFSVPTIQHDNALPYPVLRPSIDSRTFSLDLYGPSSIGGQLHKRADFHGLGRGWRMDPLKVTTYIGASHFLEALYRAAITAAVNHAAGSTTPIFRVTYGRAMMEFDSDQPIKWDDILYFASKMLGRVLNGEQNFYIANVVTAAAQTINVVMASPVTDEDTADEVWGKIVQQVMQRAGIHP